MKKLNNKGIGLLVPILVLVIMGIVIGVGYYVYSSQNKNNNLIQSSTQKEQKEPEQENSLTQDTSLDSPTVAEAKLVADSYLTAVSKCDTEAANYLRLIPKKITQSREECLQQCTKGLSFEYIKPQSYSKEGLNTEFVAFDYTFSCGDETQPFVFRLVRTPGDRGNIWLVYSTTL